jgi:hypothetical protein
MRIIEIILKLAFLALATVLFATSNFTSPWLTAFLIVSLVLGFVLIFNKHESYNYPAGYPRMKNVYIMRSIEGGLLIGFSIFLFIYVH